MSKIAFYTLGCKVNQYESEALKEMFLKRGDEVVEPEDIADVYIINTCTVTQMSEKKSRQLIRRAKRLNPEALVIAIGCYAQIAPDEIMGIDGVNLVMGTRDRNKLLEYLEALSYNERVSVVSEIEHRPDFEEMNIDGSEDRARVFLKVQDGCNVKCTYCIIPYARGNIRSRSIENSVEEVRRIVANGYKEVVLSGIHLSSYGYDLGRVRLIDLIEAIAQVDGLERIRLGSLEPMVVTEDFARRISLIDKVCDQFHLSLQSGSDGVLKRMKRLYHADQFKRSADFLKNYYENPALTTDIIVGFPGESDEEHRQSMQFCEEIGFSEMHVFKYSPRYGTPAAKMEDQVGELIKSERSQEFITLMERLKDGYESRLIGKECEILVERLEVLKLKNNFTGEELDLPYAEGRGKNHIPMYVFGSKALRNTFETAVAKDIYDGVLLGGDVEMIDKYKKWKTAQNKRNKKNG